MRWSRTCLGVAVMALVPLATFTSPPAQAERVTLMFGEVDLPIEPTTTTTLPPAAPVVTAAPPTTVPVVDEAVVNYVLRTTPPDELIRYYFRDTSPAVIERMLVIACREGGIGKGRGHTWQEACSPSHRVPAVPLSCGADNPTSSASGAFQFMGSWRGWGGFDWRDIAGPDCLADVQMARAVWAAEGFGPWE